jgi:NAD+ synthase
MTILLKDPQKETERVICFIRHTYRKQKIKHAVIAVSGGIDSALSLTLLVRALGTEHVYPILLPYRSQSCKDSLTLCRWNKIPRGHIVRIEIGQWVDDIVSVLRIKSGDLVRKGNIIARVRMIILFDMAKQKQAMVCGTENKSEKYLGYFTRFGDSASDVEPIQHWYKTQIIQISKTLQIPKRIIQKAPSAELWENQTDEQELGFSYQKADMVIEAYIHNKENKKIVVPGVSKKVIGTILDRIKSQHFKQRVPFTIK